VPIQRVGPIIMDMVVCVVLCVVGERKREWREMQKRQSVSVGPSRRAREVMAVALQGTSVAFRTRSLAQRTSRAEGSHRGPNTGPPQMPAAATTTTAVKPGMNSEHTR
jgi:hypothetical protein